LISIISLTLALLEQFLASEKGQQLAAEVVADIQAAVDALKKVQGSPVTLEQLESMKIDPNWLQS